MAPFDTLVSTGYLVYSVDIPMVFAQLCQQGTATTLMIHVEISMHWLYGVTRTKVTVSQTVVHPGGAS